MTTAVESATKGKVKKCVMKEFDLDKITWERRFRDDLGNIDGLVESIIEKGVIQPVTITPTGLLLAGERRVTAARKAGLTKIPAIIRDTLDEADAREIELYENVFRQDFSWDERVKLVAEIDRLNKAKDCNWSMRKTAEFLGVGIAQVSRQNQLAAAVEVMPELATMAKNEHEAFKILKKLEEQHITQILHERQGARVARGELDFLRIADANYRCGDVFKGLSELRSGGMIDFIECDPPYGIGLNDIKRVDGPTSTVNSYNEVPTAEYGEFVFDLAQELFRVANKDCFMAFWYGPSNHELVRGNLMRAGWIIGEIPAIWIKGSGQTMQPSTNLANCYEPFFVCRKGNPVLAKPGRSNVFDFTPTAGQKKYHPTERPVHLVQELLLTFAHPNSSVLVPFLGSGATLRACYLEGFKGFGWDLNCEYKPKFMLAVEDDLAKLNGVTTQGE